MEIIKTFASLFKLLTIKQKREFIILQCVMFFAAIFELISVTSIIPLMTLLSDLSNLDSVPLLIQIKSFLNFETEIGYLVFFGSIFVLAMFISNLMAVLNLYLSERYSSRLSAEISSKLLSYYLGQDILNFHRRNPSVYITNMFSFCQRACRGIIGQTLVLNSKIAVSITLIITIAVVNPILTVLIFSVIGSAYGIIYFNTKKHVEENSKSNAKCILNSMRLIRDALSDLKSIKLYKLKDNIINDYYESILKANRADANNVFISNIPYNLMEIIAVSSLVLMLLFFSIQGKNISEYIDLLAFLTLAGFRILSSFQKSYNCITRIKGAIPQYLHIKGDLIQANKLLGSEINTNKNIDFDLQRDIKLENINFFYSEKEDAVFENLDINIPANSVTVISGKSGRGKSTLLELIIGFIKPQGGDIKIGDTTLDVSNFDAWTQYISYVSQSPFVSDSTLAENIAYGCEKDKIDYEKIHKLCEIVQLDNFIKTLDDGYMSEVGDNASLISGGQKQRLGIARALYRDTPIVIFDEATSALDKETEVLLWKSVLSYCSGKTVIIVTHDDCSINNVDHKISL